MISKLLYLVKVVILVCLWSTSSAALVLEDINKVELEKLISGKKVAYYVGSFDPLHKGHEQNIRDIVDQGIADFCLVCPVWGGDGYKDRTDVGIRLNMLYVLYEKSPHVIVTRLSPGEMQSLLTVDCSETVDGKRKVKSRFSGAQYVGLLGSDVALDLIGDNKKCSVFMRGIKIPTKYSSNTIGSIMALPVSEFIVYQRSGDKLTDLGSSICGRSVTVMPLSHYADVSSTKIRGNIKEGIFDASLLSSEILGIIKKEKLYG